MPSVKIDHCVVTVTDWARSNAFYAAVVGAEVVSLGAGWAYRLEAGQLNVHGPGVPGDPNARLPVPPAEAISASSGRGRSWRRSPISRPIRCPWNPARFPAWAPRAPA